jgi:predicted RNase H-like HicB family nuclease
VPSYTAVLFTNTDGSHTVRIPALPSCEAQGATRAEALENAKAAILDRLAELKQSGQRPPREEGSPVRTVWVQNPRRKDTAPFVVALEGVEDGQVAATPVLFPDLRTVAATAEEALALVGPRLYEHLVWLVAQKRFFPVQDDPHAYVVRVPAV